MMQRLVLTVVTWLAVMVVVVGAAFKGDYPISSIAQSEGMWLKGSAMNEYTGMSVAGGGDVDGDGVADFVVGAPWAKSLNDGALSAGHAYVLYGVVNASDTAATWPTGSTIKAIAQDNTRGRIIDGTVANTLLGEVVAIVGDVNGDRLDDIAIGTPDWNGGRGKAWLVWGKKRAEATNPLDANVLNPSKFVAITGETGDS
jgi:hypothetical protein